VELSGDELAGVTDLFGALTPAEVERAIEELAFKRGEDPPDVAGAIESAVENYRLVALEPEARTETEAEAGSTAGDEPEREAASGERSAGGERLLIPGPTAFPALPAGAEDLPHILAIDAREVSRDRLEAVVEERFRADAARAAAENDEERIEELLDASYDLESWGGFEFDDLRARLDAASAATEK
jgi:hypothetical protein